MKTQKNSFRSMRKKSAKAQHTPADEIVNLENRDPAEYDSALALDNRDDLTAIDGIDSTIEMALNSIGIERYADFLRYTPESLSEALQRRAGISLSAEKIIEQNWFDWARLMASDPEAVNLIESEAAMNEKESSGQSDTQDQTDDAGITPKAVESSNVLVARNDDEVFMIEAMPRTVADKSAHEHVQQQSGALEQEAASRQAVKKEEASEQLVALAEKAEATTTIEGTARNIVDKAALDKVQQQQKAREGKAVNPVKAEKKTVAASSEKKISVPKKSTKRAVTSPEPHKLIAARIKSAMPQTAPPGSVEKEIVLNIKRARFTQQEASEFAGSYNEKMLHGEITFELIQAGALTNKSEPVSLCSQIHAVDLSTGASEHLASKSHLVLPFQNDYQAELDFKVPKHGRYQLQVVAMLLGAQPKVAMYRGPILRVEA